MKKGGIFMKKIIILLWFVVFVLIAILVYMCYSALAPRNEYNYDGWKRVTFDENGSFMIPNEWTMTENDGYYYILDEEDKPVLVQTYSYEGSNITDSNLYCDRLSVDKTLYSQVESNGISYGKVLIKRNGIKTENYEISLLPSLVMLFWDENCSEELVLKIVSSYIMD